MGIKEQIMERIENEKRKRREEQALRKAEQYAYDETLRKERARARINEGVSRGKSEAQRQAKEHWERKMPTPPKPSTPSKSTAKRSPQPMGWGIPMGYGTNQALNSMSASAKNVPIVQQIYGTPVKKTSGKSKKKPKQEYEFSLW